MNIFTSKPIEEKSKTDFKNIRHGKSVTVSPHAYDHLSIAQRKIFKDEDLIAMIERENPRKIYLQRNGRYAVFYRRPDGYRKLITEIEDDIITIVTFIDMPEIPKYKIENE